MKILLHYNSYRQIEEYSLACQFFNRCKFLKQHADIVVCCNNENIPIEELTNRCQYECKTKIIRTTNTGWWGGQFTSLHETFHMFSDYDFVIHLTPDIYILDENPLVNLLKEEIDTNNAMIFDYHPYHADCNICYCTDFFIFKPKLTPNFFYELNQSDSNLSPEKKIFAYVNKIGLAHRTICRGTNYIHWQVDDMGFIHNHNRNLVKKILETDFRPNREEAFSHNNIHTGNSAP